MCRVGKGYLFINTEVLLSYAPAWFLVKTDEILGVIIESNTIYSAAFFFYPQQGNKKQKSEGNFPSSGE